MNKLLVATAFAAALLARPAAAVTFSSLTTIYVGTGVYDNGAGNNAGTSTIFTCTNVSGVVATLRFLVLGDSGTALGAATTTVPHGGTIRATTHDSFSFQEHIEVTPDILNLSGGVNIETTESGVFCSAMIVDAAATAPSGIELRLVRVNPHPGTVE